MVSVIHETSSPKTPEDRKATEVQTETRFTANSRERNVLRASENIKKTCPLLSWTVLHTRLIRETKIFSCAVTQVPRAGSQVRTMDTGTWTAINLR